MKIFMTSLLLLVIAATACLSSCTTMEDCCECLQQKNALSCDDTFQECVDACFQLCEPTRACYCIDAREAGCSPECGCE